MRRFQTALRIDIQKSIQFEVFPPLEHLGELHRHFRSLSERERGVEEERGILKGALFGKYHREQLLTSGLD